METQDSLTIVVPGFEIMTPAWFIKLMPQFLEQCGRVCYKSEVGICAGSADHFVRGIIKSGHESVIEHCSITVKIVGDRSMSHQLVRHRIAAYSQESQRYCDYGKLGFQVVCPPSIADIPPGTYVRDAGWHILPVGEALPQRIPIDLAEATNSWMNSVWNSYKIYCRFRSDGIPPEDARSVLPNATKTEVVTTYNLRQWRHVFVERALNKHAQWQIRGILGAICQRFAQLLPSVFSDLAERLSEDGD